VDGHMEVAGLLGSSELDVLQELSSAVLFVSWLGDRLSSLQKRLKGLNQRTQVILDRIL
jgi:ribosome-binding factor A